MDSSGQTLENNLTYETLSMFAEAYYISKYSIYISERTCNFSKISDYYDIRFKSGYDRCIIEESDKFLAFMQENLPTIYNELEYNIPVSEITLNPTEVSPALKDILRLSYDNEPTDTGHEDNLSPYILNRFGYCLLKLAGDDVNYRHSNYEYKNLIKKHPDNVYRKVRNIIVLTDEESINSVILSNYGYEFSNYLDVTSKADSEGGVSATIIDLNASESDINNILFSAYKQRKNKFGIKLNKSVGLKTLLVPMVDFELSVCIFTEPYDSVEIFYNLDRI